MFFSKILLRIRTQRFGSRRGACWSKIRRAKMSDNSGNNKNNSESRTHALALMKFFSVDVGSDMNIPNATGGNCSVSGHSGNIQVPELANLCHREFIFKVIQMFAGFVCVTIYSEALKLLKHSLITMMFPNIVFSAFLIVTGVILFSYLLGCTMPDVQTRIFNVLGMILYFSSAIVTTYECAVTKINEEDKELCIKRRYLLATSIVEFLNFFFYGMDVYYSVKKATMADVKLLE